MAFYPLAYKAPRPATEPREKQHPPKPLSLEPKKARFGHKAQTHMSCSGPFAYMTPRPIVVLGGPPIVGGLCGGKFHAGVSLSNPLAFCGPPTVLSVRFSCRFCSIPSWRFDGRILPRRGLDGV